MTKKILLNDVEILTAEDDASAQNLLGMVESVIGRFESDLDSVDENFQAHIEMELMPNQPTRHSVSTRSLSNNGTRGKVMRILEKSTNPNLNNISGTVRFDLQVEDA